MPSHTLPHFIINLSHQNWTCFLIVKNTLCKNVLHAKIENIIQKLDNVRYSKVG